MFIPMMTNTNNTGSGKMTNQKNITDVQMAAIKKEAMKTIARRYAEKLHASGLTVTREAVLNAVTKNQAKIDAEISALIQTVIAVW
jgi:hypothetical protein